MPEELRGWGGAAARGGGGGHSDAPGRGAWERPPRPWGPSTVHQCPSLTPGARVGGGGRQWSGSCIPDACLSPAPPPPPQDALCTPARRLLQDSQDVPVTVTPLRAERVLLFDDVLVLLQVGRGRPEVWGSRWGPGSGWKRREVGKQVGVRTWAPGGGAGAEGQRAGRGPQAGGSVAEGAGAVRKGHGGPCECPHLRFSSGKWGHCDRVPDSSVLFLRQERGHWRWGRGGPRRLRGAGGPTQGVVSF